MTREDGDGPVTGPERAEVESVKATHWGVRAWGWTVSWHTLNGRPYTEAEAREVLRYSPYGGAELVTRTVVVSEYLTAWTAVEPTGTGSGAEEPKQAVWREGNRIRQADGRGYNDAVSDDAIRRHIAGTPVGDRATVAFARAVLAVRELERTLASGREGR